MIRSGVYMMWGYNWRSKWLGTKVEKGQSDRHPCKTCTKKIAVQRYKKFALQCSLWIKSKFLEFEFIGVLRHMQRYFSHICDGTDVQADEVEMQESEQLEPNPAEAVQKKNRFKVLSEKDLAKLEAHRQSVATKRNTKRGVNLFEVFYNGSVER